MPSVKAYADVHTHIRYSICRVYNHTHTEVCRYANTQLCLEPRISFPGDKLESTRHKLSARVT